MKITIDPKKCIGCNMCGDISEGAVGTEYGKDGRAGVNPKANLNNESVKEAIRLAAETCPVQAIKIEE